MPYDGFSIGVIIASVVLLAGASSSHFSQSIRLGCVLAAALLIRFDAASQFSLHQWDERYHALVARNLIAHPLTPALYREAFIPYDYRDWMANQIWLHKPPGALWPMAASMAIFGVNEIAMRLPSILLSTLAVWLTYLIGAHLFGAPVGLLAAAFQAINGFLVSLAAGRRIADHVDTALILWIELGVWMALVHARRRDTASLIVAGVALAAGLTTKSLPALLIVGVAFAIFTTREPVMKALSRSALVAAIGLALWSPWMIYTRIAFPLEADWSWQYTLQHLVMAVEGHNSSAWRYLLDMPVYFGELVWIPLVASSLTVVRGPHARGVIAWIAITYLVFAIAPTRISSFVMIAAPAIFLLQANFWHWLRGQRALLSTGAWQAATGVLLFGLLVLPARYLLDPANVFERRDRSPAESQRLRHLDAVLQLPRGAIFNVPTPIEAMFYSRLIAYSRLPTGEQVAALTARGIPIVIYLTEGTPPIPAEWNAIIVTPAQLR